MISLFSSIKEFLPDSREYPFKGGLVKKKKSVIIDPYTCLPDSNNSYTHIKRNIYATLSVYLCSSCFFLYKYYYLISLEILNPNLHISFNVPSAVSRSYAFSSSGSSS